MAKKILSLLLALSVILSVAFVFPVSAAEILFSDDFEKRAIGGFSANNSVYDKNDLATKWTILGTGEVKTEEITGNKFFKMINKESATMQMAASKSFDTSQDTRDYVWEFDINTMGNKVDIRTTEYQTAPESSKIDVLLTFTANGRVLLRGSSNMDVGAYDMEQWQHVRIEGDVTNNHMLLYLNGELVGDTVLYNKYPVGHLYRIYQVMISLGSEKYIYLDNYKIERLEIGEVSNEGESDGEVNWGARAKLKEWEGVHPRLLMTQEKFDNLKKKIEGNVSPYLNQTYDRIIKEANSMLNYKVPAFDDAGENLWISEVGLKIYSLAFAYKMTGDKKYFDKAYYIADTLLSFPKWTGASSPDGSFNELGSKGAFYGISIFWDWCYDTLTANQKYEMLSRMVVCGESMNGGGWWRSAYMQNHMTHGRSSAFIMSAAIYDDYPEALTWMSTSIGSLRRNLELWATDGTGHEGNLYYRGAMQDLTTFATICEDVVGINALDSNAYKVTGDWSLYNCLPVDHWQSSKDQFGFDDATPYSSFDMIGFIPKLADRHKLPVIQWYAEQLAEARNKFNMSYNVGDVYFMANYNENFKSEHPKEHPEEYPYFRHFDDTDYVYLREGWNGDDDSIAFKSGYVMGKNAAEYRASTLYDLGMGHMHAANNHFLIHSNGEWLFADDGYTTSTTANHNVPLINGYGQVGDPTSGTDIMSWTSTERIKQQNIINPHVVKTQFDENIAYVYTDSLEAYYIEAHQLEKVMRHFLYIKDKKVFIIVDEFKSLVENEYQTRLKPNVQTPVEQADGSYTYKGSFTNMTITPFAEGGVVENKSESFVSGKDGGKVDKMRLSITKKATEWTPAFAIAWNDIDKAEPYEVGMRKEDNKYIFTVDNSEYIIDCNDYSVTEKKFTYERNVKVNGKLMEFENEPVLRNGTVMVDAEAVLKELVSGDKLSLITEGSKSVSVNGNTFDFAEPAERINGVLYAPLRMICRVANSGVYYDAVSQIAVADANMDMKNAEVYKMSVNGNTAELSGNTYTAMFYGGSLDIIPVPEVKGATYRVEKCPGVFGESKVYVTSADGTVTKEFNVISKPQENIGNIPVHNVITDIATISEMMLTFDRDLSTTWPISGSGYQVVYDLGSVHTLGQVVIAFNHGNERKQLVDIELSADGENYTRLFSGHASGKTKEGDYFDMKKTPARFVRITYNGHSSGGGWNNTREVGFIAAE